MKVAFYKGTDKIFNKGVAWWDNGPYSHCEIIVGETPQGSVCLSSSASDGGVRAKVIKLNPEKWDIVEVDGDLDFALKVFSKHAGCGYDYLGLVGFLVRVIPGEKDKFFCSELCAMMLGLQDAWRFSPNALYCALVRYKT